MLPGVSLHLILGVGWSYDCLAHRSCSFSTEVFAHGRPWQMTGAFKRAGGGGVAAGTGIAFVIESQKRWSFEALPVAILPPWFFNLQKTND